MEVKIITRTVDALDNETSKDYSLLESKIIAGREAGICYSSESYSSEGIHNREAALKRADNLLKMGHYSPFDHITIGLEIDGIPKILAMMLNSLEFYTTSEKSARYTKMKPQSDRELNLYEKWTSIIEKQIKEVYGDIPNAKKLAMENARYMLSVFTPTTMGYTTTFRQFSYICYWLKQAVSEFESHPNKLNVRLKEYCNELYNKLIGLTDGLIPTTSGGFENFLPCEFGAKELDVHEYIGDVFSVESIVSLSSLAQKQRHRTLHVFTDFSGETSGKYGYYIPKIIRCDEYLVDKWLKDIKSLADFFPQGTLVKVVEQGLASDFFRMCYERLCGRAQLETMEATASVMKKFIENKDKLSLKNQEKLAMMTSKHGDVQCRCLFEDFKCKEPCYWGAKGGLTRLV